MANRWRLLAAAFAPFLILAFVIISTRWALIGPHAIRKIETILAIALVGLVVSARWLSLAAIPMYVAIATVVAGRAWQRVTFLAAIPADSLRYGFFVTPVGRRPRFLILELPFTAILIALAVLLAIGIIVAWRSGARWSIALLVAWWLVAAVIFSLPSLYLYLQGDAAIFI
jgi:hypothetical protein